MLSAGVPPVSPMPVEGDGSWIWILVAVGAVVAMLALYWLAGLSERSGRVDQEESEVPEVPSFQERKAA